MFSIESLISPVAGLRILAKKINREGEKINIQKNRFNIVYIKNNKKPFHFELFKKETNKQIVVPYESGTLINLISDSIKKFSESKEIDGFFVNYSQDKVEGYILYTDGDKKIKEKFIL